MTMLYTCL